MGIFTLTNQEFELADGSRLAKEELGVTWRRLFDSDTPALLEELTFHNFTLRSIRFSIAFVFRSALKTSLLCVDC